MRKSAEEIGIIVARYYYTSQAIMAVGLDEGNPLVRLIAAAIREDRAEPVSESAECCNGLGPISECGCAQTEISLRLDRDSWRRVAEAGEEERLIERQRREEAEKVLRPFARNAAAMRFRNADPNTGIETSLCTGADEECLFTVGELAEAREHFRKYEASNG